MHGNCCHPHIWVRRRLEDTPSKTWKHRVKVVHESFHLSTPFTNGPTTTRSVPPTSTAVEPYLLSGLWTSSIHTESTIPGLHSCLPCPRWLVPQWTYLRKGPVACNQAAEEEVWGDGCRRSWTIQHSVAATVFFLVVAVFPHPVCGIALCSPHRFFSLPPFFCGFVAAVFCGLSHCFFL